MDKQQIRLELLKMVSSNVNSIRGGSETILDVCSKYEDYVVNGHPSQKASNEPLPDLGKIILPRKDQDKP